MKTHYVYRLTISLPNDSRKYYVGKHSGYLDDFETGKYKTSSKIVSKLLKEGKEFKYKIVKLFNTAQEALNFETKYLSRVDAKNNILFFNLINHPPKKCELTTLGKVPCLNKITGKNCSVSKDEFYNHPDIYETFQKNKVTAWNKETNIYENVDVNVYVKNKNIFSLSSSDMVFCYNEESNRFDLKVPVIEYQKNKDKYITFHKNKITVFNRETNKYEKIPIDSYAKNKDKYCSALSGKIIVRNKENSKIEKIQIDLFYNNREKYEAISKNTVSCLDISDGVFKRVPSDEYNVYKNIKYFNPNSKIAKEFKNNSLDKNF